MATSKSETHDFNISDVGKNRSNRSVRINVYMARAFDESEKGFTDEEINEIKEAEKAFIAVVEKVICK